MENLGLPQCWELEVDCWVRPASLRSGKEPFQECWFGLSKGLRLERLRASIRQGYREMPFHPDCEEVR